MIYDCAAQHIWHCSFTPHPHPRTATAAARAAARRRRSRPPAAAAGSPIATPPGGPRPSTAQHSTAQHSTAQHSTTQPCSPASPLLVFCTLILPAARQLTHPLPSDTQNACPAASPARCSSPQPFRPSASASVSMPFRVAHPPFFHWSDSAICSPLPVCLANAAILFTPSPPQRRFHVLMVHTGLQPSLSEPAEAIRVWGGAVGVGWPQSGRSPMLHDWPSQVTVQSGAVTLLAMQAAPMRHHCRRWCSFLWLVPAPAEGASRRWARRVYLSRGLCPISVLSLRVALLSHLGCAGSLPKDVPSGDGAKFLPCAPAPGSHGALHSTN